MLFFYLTIIIKILIVLDIFNISSLSYLRIEIHYQGRSITKIFDKQNPGLFTHYPSAEDVTGLRAHLLNNKAQGVIYTIVVFEEGIYTVES